MLWARKSSQHHGPFWPALCLGILTFPSQKARHTALIERNEVAISGKLRSELMEAKEGFKDALKCQCLYMIEFLDSPTITWVPESDIDTFFDCKYDPNKKGSGRMLCLDILTSPEYIHAFQRGILVHGEQQQHAVCTDDAADKPDNCDFEKLAQPSDTDLNLGYMTFQVVNSIPDVDECNCLLASEGLLDYSTLGQIQDISKHPRVCNQSQKDQELPLQDAHPPKKRQRQTSSIERTTVLTGGQVHDGDLTVAALGSCQTVNSLGDRIHETSVIHQDNMNRKQACRCENDQTPKFVESDRDSTIKVSPKCHLTHAHEKTHDIEGTPINHPSMRKCTDAIEPPSQSRHSPPNIQKAPTVDSPLCHSHGAHDGTRDIDGTSGNHTSSRECSHAIKPPSQVTAQAPSKSSGPENSEGMHNPCTTPVLENHAEPNSNVCGDAFNDNVVLQLVSPTPENGGDLSMPESSMERTTGRTPATFLKFVLEGEKVQSENVLLRKNFVKLKEDLEALQKNHRRKIAAFKVLLESEEVVGHEKVETVDSELPYPELEELSPPADNDTGVAYLVGFASYLQAVAQQNTLLVETNAMVQDKISNLHVRQCKLKKSMESVAGDLGELF